MRVQVKTHKNAKEVFMKYKTVTCCLTSAALAGGIMAQTGAVPEIPDSYAGYTGVYPGFQLVIDERFNHLDTSLWRVGDGAVEDETMCRFQPEGVTIDAGKLKLIIDRKKVPASWSEDHQQTKKPYNFMCGELRTHNDRPFHYGRIEARIKSPDRASATGYISSLFTYRFDKDDSLSTAHDTEWEEIDVEMEGSRPDKFQANLIYGLDTWEWSHTREFGAWEEKIDIGPVDTWRVFAIEWLPDAIRWYVDGQLVRTLQADALDCDPECVPPQMRPTPIPDNPTTILMNFWIPNDDIQNDFGGNKSGNVYPMTTEYDWLRYYAWTGAAAPYE